MKAISVRQPWAWAILSAGKRIENRTWATAYRGPILIHAAKGCTREEHYEAASWMARLGLAHVPGYVTKQLALAGATFPAMPPMGDLPRGRIIARARLVDCVRASNSPWFCGPCGFVLEDVEAVPEVMWRGELGLFEVPDDLLADAQRA